MLLFSCSRAPVDPPLVSFSSGQLLPLEMKWLQQRGKSEPHFLSYIPLWPSCRMPHSHVKGEEVEFKIYGRGGTADGKVKTVAGKFETLVMLNSNDGFLKDRQTEAAFQFLGADFRNKMNSASVNFDAMYYGCASPIKYPPSPFPSSSSSTVRAAIRMGH